MLLLGKLFGPVVLLSLLAYACATQSSRSSDDPFDDPFFSDSFSRGTSSLDEILREPSPSVGWLAREGAVPPPRGSRRGAYDGGAVEVDENVLLAAEDPDGEGEVFYGEEDEELVPARGQRSFYDRASEATLATMSVLVGAGMAALPFLVGAY